MNLIDKNTKSILIYNPISDIGHFDSWCKIFTTALLKNNWTVIVLTKNKKLLKEYLDKEFNNYRNNYIILNDCNIIKSNANNVIVNDISSLKFIKYINIKLNGIKINKINLFKKIIFNFLFFITSKLEFLFKKLFHQVIISSTNPSDFANDINLVISHLHFHPKIILNMYLDLYDSNPDSWALFSQKMKFNWTGIHMDTSNTLVNRPYEQSPTLKLIFTINQKLNKLENNKFRVHYRWLPDTTDTSLPSEVTPVAERIKKNARGRNIVFLGGAIGGTKNLSLWSEVLFKIDPSKWYFVQIGKVDYGTLSTSDLIALQKLQTSTIENLFLIDGFLEDEAIFNEVITISSVVWALYKDFDRSSNILTKAALFSRPVIVSNKYLMGQRVNTYKIGLTVPEDSAEETIDGLNWLIANPIPLSNFENYASVYSAQALSIQLEQSLRPYAQ